MLPNSSTTTYDVNVVQHFICDSTNQDILECLSLNRIKTILNTFNHSICEKTENHTNIIKKINDIFNDDYTTTELLNDFYHIKYHHKIDENNIEFNKIFKYLTNSNVIRCDSTCH
eukprot:172928_1